jgi:hypothetical protein
MAQPAVPAQPIFNGAVLSVSPELWQVTTSQAKTVHQLATAGRRETFTYWGPGWPLIKTKREVQIEWSHLKGEVGAMVERMLAAPGPHRLILWQPVDVAYAGDGSRAAYTCPWHQALDLYPIPPGGVPSSIFMPQVRLTLAGAPLNCLFQTAEAYSAGEPDEGDVWFLAGQGGFKLSAPPSAGSTVYLTTYPVLEVLEAPDSSRSFKNPVSRPRTLVLLEV